MSRVSWMDSEHRSVLGSSSASNSSSTRFRSKPPSRRATSRFSELPFNHLWIDSTRVTSKSLPNITFVSRSSGGSFSSGCLEDAINDAMILKSSLFSFIFSSLVVRNKGGLTPNKAEIYSRRSIIPRRQSPKATCWSSAYESLQLSLRTLLSHLNLQRCCSRTRTRTHMPLPQDVTTLYSVPFSKGYLQSLIQVRLDVAVGHSQHNCSRSSIEGSIESLWNLLLRDFKVSSTMFVSEWRERNEERNFRI